MLFGNCMDPPLCKYLVTGCLVYSFMKIDYYENEKLYYENSAFINFIIYFLSIYFFFCLFLFLFQTRDIRTLEDFHLLYCLLFFFKRIDYCGKL